MKALEHLTSLLRAGAQQSLSRPWEPERSIDRHINRLDRHLQQGTGAFVPRNLQEEAVRRFWSIGRVDNLKDARLVSFGVALPVGSQRLRVIEDRERFQSLLRGVDGYRNSPRRFRRCYQGLLSGYFGYDPEAKETPQAGHDNWLHLRNYLGDRSGFVLDGERNPQWTETLQDHRNLFDADPCLRYGPALLAGDHAEVDHLREAMNVPDSSWFMRKLFLAQVLAAVERRDLQFLELLPNLLEMLRAHELIRDEGLALVLGRHVRLQPAPLVIPLRDAAVDWWGNPWLQSNAMRWGRVTPEARAMVSDWLKLEFIETFFTLLAEERTGDSRRLKFWGRYVHAIEDIHFALGRDARENASVDFRALRKKMTGLIVPLQDNVRSNNAFVMRIGRLVVVEFSGYSNACYGYDATQPLPFQFDRPVVLPRDDRNSLKHSAHALWLAHQDGVHGYGTWEDRFEAELANGYGIRPKHLQAPTRSVASAPRPLPAAGGSRTPSAAHRTPDPGIATEKRILATWQSMPYRRENLTRFAEQFGLEIEDLTPQNGNLWVRSDGTNLGINKVLTTWGFVFKNAQKGWWRKGR